MKPIRRNKQFEKHFKKRITPHEKLITQFEQRFEQFIIGVRGRPLNDHPLTGNMVGKRAFSITGDIRVVYTETAEAIIFLDIGTHAQVYAM